MAVRGDLDILQAYPRVGLRWWCSTNDPYRYNARAVLRIQAFFSFFSFFRFLMPRSPDRARAAVRRGLTLVVAGRRFGAVVDVRVSRPPFLVTCR